MLPFCHLLLMGLRMRTWGEAACPAAKAGHGELPRDQVSTAEVGSREIFWANLKAQAVATCRMGQNRKRSPTSKSITFPVMPIHDYDEIDRVSDRSPA